MENLEKRIESLSPAKRALLELRRKQSPARTPGIMPRKDRSQAPPSYAQERLWFLDQLEPNGALYNVPRALRLKGKLNLEALQQAFDKLVERHETFRTRFEVVDGDLRQVIDDGERIPLTLDDLTELSAEAREARVNDLAQEEAARPFDLARGPLMRIRLLRLNDLEHVLLMTNHHIISDAWSGSILFKELSAIYNSLVSDRAVSLSTLNIQYGDFAAWQRGWLQGDELQRQLSYWAEQLEGASGVLELPADFPRSQAQQGRGEYKFLTLAKELSLQLNELSHREGVTLFMTLLAAFQILLARYSNQTEVVVGSPIAGRNRAETENLIGFFINTLVLRAKLARQASFTELLSQVKETALGAFAHQDLPFEKLVEELQPERDLGRNPLFQVMFQFQNTASPKLEMEGLEVNALEVSTGTAKFDLMLAAREENQSLVCVMEYNSELFAGETIEQMLQQYATLLANIVARPDEAIARLSLMTAAEEQQLVETWNDNATPFPAEKTIQQLFEEQVTRAPHKIALKVGESSVSFRELNDQSNQLAGYLRRQGLLPEDRVGICLERSVETIVALLAVLKAGSAYVPLEPSYPAERISFIIENSQAKFILTKKSLAGALNGQKTICLDDIGAELEREGKDNLIVGVTAKNAAHVIYTSGSTGRPKGVISSHSASVNRFAWMWQRYPFTTDDVCCQKTSLSFVDSIWEIFGPLLRGVPLVIIPDDTVKDPSQFVAALAANKVTRLVLVPSLLRAMLEDFNDLSASLSSLRICVCSGETLSPALAAEFGNKLPGARLINLYGSSEVAADVTCFEVSPAKALRSVPIGRPIANTQVYVLDDDLRSTAIGVPGEIFVGGEGLARGYLNHPEMTAERFIPNPFAVGRRLFRTGDFGRHLAGGNIEYRGRRDHQVKLRGFRIELGEIEAALKAHERISEAVVVLRHLKGQREDDQHLVAYLTATSQPPAPAELRSFLRGKLPEFMAPAVFTMLEQMPLTASGKVNRQALPEPDRADPQNQFVAPRTQTEELLAGIWAAELRLDAVGISDDFFAVGGHSLLLARIGARIRETFKINLPLRALFEASTITALAEQVERARRADQDESESPLVRVPRDNELPLSFTQERLWFFDQLEPNSGAYNIPRALRLHGALDRDALERSLAALCERHEVLRSTFHSDQGKPVLRISETATSGISWLDLTTVDVAEREASTSAAIKEETGKPFDLARGPLLRLAVVKLSEAEHVLILTMHHIVSDGWSVGLALSELVDGYNAFLAGNAPARAELPVQYADYAAWKRRILAGGDLEKQISFWRSQLEGAPSLINLPLDRPRAAVRSFRGAKLPLSIPDDIATALKQLGRAERATLFMTLLAAFEVFLALVSGDDDVVVGTPTAGRERAETQNLIGYFVNTIVLRAKVKNDQTFREIVNQVREQALSAFANQDVPLERLIDELGMPRTLEFNPLFQVWFVLQNATVERQQWSGLQVEPVEIESTVTRHDLQLAVWESGAGLEGAFTFNTDLFGADTISRFAEQFKVLLGAVTANSDILLGELRRKLEEVGRELQQRQAERLEDASRELLRATKRRAVSVAETLETI
jgi:amino acid adenylation domain-containing protein